MSRRYNVFCSVGEDHRNDYKVNAGLVIVEHVTGSRRLSICVVAARHHYNQLGELDAGSLVQERGGELSSARL